MAKPPYLCVSPISAKCELYKIVWDKTHSYEVIDALDNYLKTYFAEYGNTYTHDLAYFKHLSEDDQIGVSEYTTKKQLYDISMAMFAEGAYCVEREYEEHYRKDTIRINVMNFPKKAK